MKNVYRFNENVPYKSVEFSSRFLLHANICFVYLASGMKTQLGYRFSVGQLPLWAQKQVYIISIPRYLIKTGCCNCFLS